MDVLFAQLLDCRVSGELSSQYPKKIVLTEAREEQIASGRQGQARGASSGSEWALGSGRQNRAICSGDQEGAPSRTGG